MNHAYYVVSDKDDDVINSCDSQTDDAIEKCPSHTSSTVSFRLLRAYHTDKRKRRRAKHRHRNTVALPQLTGVTASLPVPVANSHDVGPEVREKAEEEERALTVVGPSRREVIVSFCKRLVAFLLSTVGLSILTVIYTIAGALIFSAIELPHEQLVQSGVNQSIDWHVTALWQLTAQLNVLHEVTALGRFINTEFSICFWHN